MDKKTRRQRSLMQHLEQFHYISLEEIATRFSVTTQTARRDIQELEMAGKVRRLHGGATAAHPIDPGVLRARRVENAEAKQRIGAAVAARISNGSAIFIDTGTTCEAVALALLGHKDLRVVTYSLRVATALSEGTDFTVAVPGGFVRRVDSGVFRQDTPEFIGRFKFDTAIISVSGIDSAGDIGDDDHAEVAAVQAAMKQAETIILAVDGSKFGRRALVKLASLRDVHELVTDAPPRADLMHKLNEAGVGLFIAGKPDESAA
ncbi:glycerol-3-phosphate transcriptional regulator protein [Pleomorphomonas diazotrophica]|uniref:Glycerol-3-phosphate transcriptional regulator protein n=1 Tax=Pleomorphomonas diazotrophica TaxID=1166257 RepID=A0A1I4UW92_9HYPH|nr:DeoR/GlpR family DNA-binding transcription regulator [Pleomorphomonas diazotrophica]PKR89774.1 glycerol-3-phosphate transcriptional regulator protein [Pleomorphomonas diazotrophica]SFM93060.1 transcriptional regulator, DeoR family [Pleomorphomonas diazotrophica]